MREPLAVFIVLAGIALLIFVPWARPWVFGVLAVCNLTAAIAIQDTAGGRILAGTMSLFFLICAGATS